MKTVRKPIEISELDFIICPEMYIGLKYLEVNLSKTIDSFEAVSFVGTDISAMVPVVTDVYYFFTHIHCIAADNDSQYTISLQLLDGMGSYWTSLVCYDNSAAPGVAYYGRTLDILNIFCAGGYAGPTFNNISAYGIKISTS